MCSPYPDQRADHLHENVERSHPPRQFAAQCERTLQVGGRLYLVTDVGDYFAVMTELLQQQARLKLLSAGADATQLALNPKEPSHDLDYLTNFERKFRKEGRPIYREVYERV